LKLLAKNTEIDFKIVNLAVAAKCSCAGNEIMFEKIKDAKIKLSSSDLVLLDFSINDAAKLSVEDSAAVFRLQLCVEKLIRKLLSFNGDSNNPAVVLLEHNPFESVERHSHSHMQLRDRYKYGYTYVYRQLARHYAIPIWSYHDVVHSEFAHQHHLQKKYIDILQFKDTCALCGAIHPAWYVHLFTADLYGSILLTEMLKCTSPTNSHHNSIYNKNKHMKEVHENKSYNSQINRPLPAMLTTLNASMIQCNQSIPPLLRISAEDIVLNRTHIGSYHPHLSDSTIFPVLEDRPGKFGWVDEFPIGFIGGIKRALHLQLRNSSELPPLLVDIYNTETPMMLRIEYMRTYLNAGVILASVCGYWIGENIETYWADKISVSEFYLVNRRINFKVLCSKESRRDNGYRLSDAPTLELLHMFQGVGSIWDYNNTRTEKEKVKVIDVMLCAMET